MIATFIINDRTVWRPPVWAFCHTLSYLVQRFQLSDSKLSQLCEQPLGPEFTSFDLRNLTPQQRSDILREITALSIALSHGCDREIPDPQLVSELRDELGQVVDLFTDELCELSR